MSELTGKIMTYVGGPADADSALARVQKEMERTKNLLKYIAPPGTLGLPKLLDERRIEHGITNGAFRCQASFDRVFVYQLPLQKGDKFNDDSKIVMAESTQQRERNRAPFGVIVSAGLNALDGLRSHGIDVGHRVYFAHTAPYTIRTDTVEGREFHLVILQVGDIIGSEDLAVNLRERKVFYKSGADADGAVLHTFQDENGKVWIPAEARPGEI